MKPIDNSELKELLKETPETIATDIIKRNNTQPLFASVDLWRVQKKQRTLGSSTKW